MPAPAQAQVQETPSIAVIDLEKLLIESVAAQSIHEQTQQSRDQFKEELSKLESELRKQQKQLSEERTTLPQEEFAEKLRAFEEKRLETRALLQKRKRSLDEAYTKTMGKLQAEIYRIVETMADERDYSLVLTRSNVFMGTKSLNITDEVMEKLNARVQDIKFEIEAP